MQSREETQADLSAVPNIACLCVTFNRPHLLPNLIESFNRQDYPLLRRQLLILDDCGQYPTEPGGDGWQVISVRRRFETLSAKRNALAAMTGSDVDAIAIWDDDDTYLPWALLASAWAMKRGPVSHPSVVLTDKLKLAETGQKLYQASTAIDRDLFLDLGGYPRGNSGVDQKLVSLLREKSGPAIDPTEHFPPFYVYGWQGTQSPHLSTLGADGYDGEKLREQAGAAAKDQQSDIIPKWSRQWDRDARAALGIPVGTGTYDLPQWWAENRPAKPEATEPTTATV
jgi:hypothetical protein